MNAAWAREWAANFANPDKLIDMYADDAQFEDVIIAHKESGKAEIKKFGAVLIQLIRLNLASLPQLHQLLKRPINLVRQLN
jgi:ketosteroid isomerase-like protein